MSLQLTDDDSLPAENRPAEKALASESYVQQVLPGILTPRDLTFLFVIILFFITNDSNAVAGGPAGLALWLIGGLLFFVPCGIATAQLGILFPHEGSLYSWTHHTFGGFMSFFVGFVAWVPGPLLILANAELVVNMIQFVRPPGYREHVVVVPRHGADRGRARPGRRQRDDSQQLCKLAGDGPSHRGLKAARSSPFLMTPGLCLIGLIRSLRDTSAAGAREEHWSGGVGKGH
ncbi:MAG: APC family permease [Ktedonobacteraceae bacterium]|nr:APC family permease [Ktedonobacteraceae bacterium]